MRVIVIGGTGHIGEHLVPMLVRDGLEVVIVARGEQQTPPGDEWSSVQFVKATYRPNAPSWRNGHHDTPHAKALKVSASAGVTVAARRIATTVTAASEGRATSFSAAAPR